MMKFKKGLAAAMIGAMLLGTVATGIAVTPVVNVYAENELTVTPDKTKVTAGEEATVVLTVKDADGNDVTSDVAMFTADPDTGVSFGTGADYHKMTIAKTVLAGTSITVTARVTKAGVTTSGTATITVEAVADENPTVPTVGAFTTNVDYANYTLELSTTGSDRYAFVEVWKLKEDKLANTYSYPLKNGAAVVDLSFLKASTAQGIKVYGDVSAEPVEVKIAAQPEKLSLKYNPVATNLATSFTGKIGKVQVDSLEVADYQYRGQYGAVWTDLADFENVNHISAGSTIIVRAKATDITPAGPEAKVKIAAAAKAPKVKIDYAKNTVTFPKKAEYSVDGINFTAIEESKIKATPEELRKLFGNDGTTDLVIFVRTTADNTKKKAASNVTYITIPAAVAATDDAENKMITVAGNTTAKVTYAESSTKAGKYEFKAEGASFDFSTDDGETWKNVKAGKSFTVAMEDNAKTVLVRKAGVKEDTRNKIPAVWASLSVSVTVPAKGSDEVPEKADAPVVDNETGTVKVGDTVVLTVARDTDTNTTINFTVAEGQTAAAATLEYRIGETGDFSTISASLASQGTDAITIQIRVKKTEDNAASDPATLTIAAVSTP